MIFPLTSPEHFVLLPGCSVIVLLACELLLDDDRWLHNRVISESVTSICTCFMMINTDNGWLHFFTSLYVAVFSKTIVERMVQSRTLNQATRVTTNGVGRSNHITRLSRRAKLRGTNALPVTVHMYGRQEPSTSRNRTIPFNKIVLRKNQIYLYFLFNLYFQNILGVICESCFCTWPTCLCTSSKVVCTNLNENRDGPVWLHLKLNPLALIPALIGFLPVSMFCFQKLLNSFQKLFNSFQKLQKRMLYSEWSCSCNHWWGQIRPQLYSEWSCSCNHWWGQIRPQLYSWGQIRPQLYSEWSCSCNHWWGQIRPQLYSEWSCSCSHWCGQIRPHYT
jgi:hypothetical protein